MVKRYNNYLINLNPDILMIILAYLRNGELLSLRQSLSTNNIYPQVFDSLGYKSNIITMIDGQLKVNRGLLGGYFNNLRYYLYFNRTFLPLRIINKFPFITYRDSFIGSTGYIDRVRKRHLDQPIMVGRDRYGRSFVSIKYRCRDPILQQVDREIEINTNQVKVLTIFQRYSDNLHSWCKAGSVWDTDPLMSSSNTLLNSRDKNLYIINLLQLKFNEKPYYHKFDNSYNYDSPLNRKPIDCYLDDTPTSKKKLKNLICK